MPAIVFAALLTWQVIRRKPSSDSSREESPTLPEELRPGKPFDRTMRVVLLAGLAAAAPTFLYFFVPSIPLSWALAAIAQLLEHRLHSSTRMYRGEYVFWSSFAVGVSSWWFLAGDDAWGRFDDINPFHGLPDAVSLGKALRGFVIRSKRASNLSPMIACNLGPNDLPTRPPPVRDY
jgi:hypothetical protein